MTTNIAIFDWFCNRRKESNRAIKFKDVSNYRGELQAKVEDGKCFWRVSCDVDEDEPWREMPRYLWDALEKHHAERGEGYRPLGCE